MIKDKYKLTNYCKGGAFGEVFFAKHIEKNYDVAVKFVYFNINSNNRVTVRMKKPIVNMKTK